jgi:membrane-bound serine protease (ClpP class)
MRKWTWLIGLLLILFSAASIAAENAVIQTITNPNVTYLLILLAAFGLFFEFTNPGMVIPGVVGVFSLLLALYALQLMPVNYTGLSLLAIGIGFMVAELYIGSFGIIGMVGVAGFVVGSMMLFESTDGSLQVAWPLIAFMSIISALFCFIILNMAIRSHKKAVVTGKQTMIGAEGTVLSVMNEQVVVQIGGEIWEARSSRMLNKGDKIKVTHINGLMLTVE